MPEEITLLVRPRGLGDRVEESLSVYTFYAFLILNHVHLYKNLNCNKSAITSGHLIRQWKRLAETAWYNEVGRPGFKPTAHSNYDIKQVTDLP